jgi:coenzyme F420-reducing hydrogenase delta subunit
MISSLKKNAKILVFPPRKISDPAIDMAGLLKLHYPPTVYTITVPLFPAE